MIIPIPIWESFPHQSPYNKVGSLLRQTSFRFPKILPLYRIFRFQGWDPTAADWHATKGEGGIWTYEAPLSTCPCGSKFKFVVNDIDWMQPDTSMDPKYLTDDGVGGFNLVMACE